MLKRVLPTVLSVAILSLSSFLRSLATELPDELVLGFRNPPDSARPAAYWCWMNGYVDVPQALCELRQFREKGLSSLYVFDIGARDPDKVIPAGPAFMSREWVRQLVPLLSKAKEMGMEIGLITSSSWNAGGPWVTPEYGAMGLFTSQVSCEGPGHIETTVPHPQLPPTAYKHPRGFSPIYRDIAVLAVPADRVYDRPTFVFQLAPPGRHLVDHLILCNTESEDAGKTGPLHRFVKGFAVYLSDTSDAPEAFRLVVKGELKPTKEPQRFDFPATYARYVKLELLSKHNPRESRWELGEFELYTPEGQNVVCRTVDGGSRTGAALVRFTTQWKTSGPWSADCIHDGIRNGPRNSWASAEEPPVVIASPTQVIDLTERLEPDGKLHWEAPPGKWRIIRFGYGNTGQQLVLPSPNSAGWAIDHFNPAATQWHFKHILEPLIAELGPLDQTALKQLYVCSYELRGATWTPNLLEEFQRRRGYDMKPFLPVLLGCIMTDEATTRRFIRDYETTLSDLIVDAFYGRATEICHEHGLKLCAEAGGPGLPLHPVPVDALKAQGAIDIPRGEFWVDEHIWVVKETACAAHIYGKPMVDMEAFTSWRHWQDGPAELKPIADRAFCEGANHFTFHTAAHRPAQAKLPGWVYTAGTHFSPSIAWWPLAGGFVDYIARCSFLLQQGEPVADVCYYYGDRGFNFVMPKSVDPALGFGYDYTVTDTKALLERATVRQGRICFGPHDEGIPVLVLPPGSEVTPQVMQKIATLIEDGATVVGEKPQKSPSLSNYPQCDEEVRRIADRIWGEGPSPSGQRKYGAGQVFWEIPLKEVLRQLGIPPDVVVRTVPGASIDYVHRRTPDAHIYFFWNRLPRWENVVARIRTESGTPEIWDPVAGKRAKLAAFRPTADGMELPLSLPPLGSLFVVVPRHDKDQVAMDPVVSITREGKELLFSPSAGRPRVQIVLGDDGSRKVCCETPGEYELVLASGKRISFMVAPSQHEILTGAWQVEFPPGWGAPEKTTFRELISWTDHPEPGIKYFSGVATYRKTFQVSEISPDQRVLIDLGEVRFVADLMVNGRWMGYLWTPPYEVDITHAVHRGENELVVRVANVWSNRLTGDAREPQFGTFTYTNIKNALAWRVPWKEAPLHRSGLLGPVTVRIVTPVDLLHEETNHQ
ncbi:glycosyl hydrolase [Thermogutta sp.]|uniref:glycosyl hydrolase n=1 Tax=Thermogutta sp. TaxID=1962930 RepID=UPI00321FF0D1